MLTKIPADEHRTLQQLREHYLIEKELASRLRHARREERRYLYTAVYDELFRRVSSHPQLIRKADPNAQIAAISQQLRFLMRFLTPQATFMEIGPGDCSLSLAVAKLVKKVYAVDVSGEITKEIQFPQNMELLISDGCSIPIPEGTITVAYSNQLIEHLHPDDLNEQLKNVYRSLVNNGIYACITPNRLNGPHDISKYFEEVASGFHLQEFTIGELADLFKVAGFLKIHTYVGIKGFFLPLPVSPTRWIETGLTVLPKPLRKRIASCKAVKSLIGICLAATK